MSPAGATTTTGAVVALKPVELAKTRLSTLATPMRRRVAWAMAVDTLTALAAAVDHLLVVSDQPALQSRLRRLGLSVAVLGEPGPVGLNGALTFGSQELRRRGCLVVLACVGDLPALKPESVRRVLTTSTPASRCFLADASGVGTTMLLARGTELDPHFSGSSAQAHARSGAVPLTSPRLTGPLADARRDVDSETDLLEAYGLGLGAATAALFDPAARRLGRYHAVTVTDYHTVDGTQLAVTSAGHRLPLPTRALQDGLRVARTGQRLHAVTSTEAVLAAWL